MLKIRLKRVGRKNDPSFRMVVTDSRQGPKSDRLVERVGFYNPTTKEKAVDAERIQYWMSVGAQASPTVHNMLVDEGIIDDKKKNVLPRKSPVVKEEEEKQEAGEAPAEEGEATEEIETPADEESAEEEKPAEVKEEKEEDSAEEEAEEGKEEEEKEE